MSKSLTTRPDSLKSITHRRQRDLLHKSDGKEQGWTQTLIPCCHKFVSDIRIFFSAWISHLQRVYRDMLNYWIGLDWLILNRNAFILYH